MPPEASSGFPRVIMVEGDPVIAMDAVRAIKGDMIKAGMLPDGWVVFAPAEGKQDVGKLLNALEGEVSLADWDGNLKGILLRGLLDNKQFMEAMLKVIPGVAPTNTLIVLDETGVLGQEKGSCAAFRRACEKIGTIRSVLPPFKDLDGGKQKGVNQVRAIVEEVAKRGKKISSQTARDVFLEKVVPEWSYILSEIDKLAELSEGASITPKEVNDIVFPSAPSHPIYEFSIAFNSGMLGNVMRAYDDLVASKIDPEVITAYAMKIVRWQLISCHLASYGSPLPTSMLAMANRMNREAGRKRMEREMAVHPHWFHKETPEERKKIEKFDGITSFEARGVTDFVKHVFMARQPVRTDDLGTLPFNRVAMLRYIAMLECMQKIRMSRDDKAVARRAFRQAVYKACWRG